MAATQAQSIIDDLYARYNGEVTQAQQTANLTRDDFLKGLLTQYRKQVLQRKIQEQLVPDASFKPKTEPERVRASQILLHVEVLSTTTQADADALFAKRKPDADALVAQLRGGADFATLARQKSEDPGSKEKDGDLGFFGPDGTTDGGGPYAPALVKAAFALPVNQVSDPVRTPFGWAILKTTERSIPSREDQLRQARTAELDRWLAGKRKAGQVQRFPEPTATLAAPTTPPAPSASPVYQPGPPTAAPTMAPTTGPITNTGTLSNTGTLTGTATPRPRRPRTGHAHHATHVGGLAHNRGHNRGDHEHGGADPLAHFGFSILDLRLGPLWPVFQSKVENPKSKIAMRRWLPQPSPGRLIGLAIIAATLVLAALLGVRLVAALVRPPEQWPVDLTLYGQLVALLALLVLAGVLVYRVVGAWTLAYELDRNGLYILWAGNRATVPLGQVERVDVGAPGARLSPSPLRGVGYYRGRGRTDDGRTLHMFATRPLRQSLVLHTATDAYAISPADPDAFVQDLEQRRNLGVVKPLAPALDQSRIFFYAFWSDTLVRRALVVAFLLNLLLLGFLAARYPALGSTVQMRFNAAGALAELRPRHQVLFLPLAAFVVSLLNTGLGLTIYARERAGARMLQLGSVLVQVLFAIAVLSILAR